MEVINEKLDKLIGEFTSFKSEMRVAIASKDREITNLKMQVKTMDDRISELGDKIADSDIKLRENNLILSGDDVAAFTNGKNCVEVARQLFSEKLQLIVPT